MKKNSSRVSSAKLNEERTTYDEHVSAISKNVGKHVLIHGSTIVDYFPSYEKALKAGYEMYGTKPFMVREVDAKNSPTTVLRFSFKTIQGLRLHKRQKTR